MFQCMDLDANGQRYRVHYDANDEIQLIHVLIPEFRDGKRHGEENWRAVWPGKPGTLMHQRVVAEFRRRRAMH